jgi:hypothetical protein
MSLVTMDILVLENSSLVGIVYEDGRQPPIVTWRDDYFLSTSMMSMMHLDLIFLPIPFFLEN